MIKSWFIRSRAVPATPLHLRPSYLRETFGRWPMAWALVRGFFSAAPLPPGELISLDLEEKKNRHLLIELAASHGPVFKALARNELWVCVTGIARCSRFISENMTRLRPVTVDVTRLYAKGFLRQMIGEEHRHYRRALVVALREEAPTTYADELARMIASRLRDHAQHFTAGTAPTAESLISTLSEISTVLLLRIFFGEVDGSPFAARLVARFRELGPYGLVWNQGPRQEQAFHALRAMILDDLRDRPSAGAGLVRRLHATGALDETMLGHAIMMVEMGRYDMKGLFRWLLRYLGQHHELAGHIAAEPDSEPASGNSLARAFVLETFRMDQSERLIRKAEEDIVFDGYSIPRLTMIRLCLWESHHCVDDFPEPFAFNADRFRAGDLPSDQFSPFGLDEHFCPFADVAIRMGTLLVREVTRNYLVENVRDGAPIRGAYHWEPALGFTVGLHPRTGFAQ